ncbi:MAG: alpha/beta fold hydrolase [Mesorhizobium sp.]|nr:alpha/beta fold hydrolase [Mesorhizobium sp.]MBL8577947.1 alpha/beta fold hydrolase [Mesorhizobium sp.]
MSNVIDELPPRVRRRIWRYLLLTSYAIVLFVSGAVIAIAVAGILYMNAQPDLSVWHKADLDGEFTAKSKITTFREYLELEDALFAEVKTEVYDKVPEAERSFFNRYTTGSRSDPGIWTPNWNRTFEYGDSTAPFGVLMLHGYSDSPYSLRGFGATMRDAGAYVVGLRIPGHGTAPSALKYTVADDMTAAVRLAMRHMREVLGDKPIFIIGYSNGAALALNYDIEAIEDPTLPVPAGLVLMSPEIGITRAAAYSNWQARVGDLLGLDKLAWSSVLPEFDPYKYNSFAVNAGEQAWQMTQKVQLGLDRLTKAGRLGEVAPILAFQSAADATVIANAVVTNLFDRLPSGQHDLVVFDVNRFYEAEGLLRRSIDTERLVAGPPRAYSVGIVTNRNATSFDAVLRSRAAGTEAATTTELGLSWPDDIYSLSHIALPFSEEDPLYGEDPNSENPGIRLGRLALHGENNTLSIPPTMMTRQRWNPFHPFMAERIKQFITERAAATP